MLNMFLEGLENLFSLIQALLIRQVKHQYSQVELVLVMIEAGEMRDSWVQMTLSGSSPMHPRS